ncbi:MAG: hypothetical protein KBA51_04585 [Kiritimatiellae bacterium]|nr:hypothetical protein [Kiritimatiellia bacterium]
MTIPLDDLSLDARSAADRKAALEQAAARLRASPPQDGGVVNLHCHSFFSYNAWGWSPTGIVARCRAAGLAAAGLVDFDVLDGVDEFLSAAVGAGLRGCAGIESRVYVPEFSDRVINSPGEPGIAYSMGVGFPRGDPGPEFLPFLGRLRRIPEERNRKVVEAVNAHLAPVALDYDRDVLPLTPAGNATERHLCLAYARRAAAVYADRTALAKFWSSKLKHTIPSSDLPESPALQARIRAATMKRGGPGYVPPDSGSFPTQAEFWTFVRDAGAIPTVAWLDGSSEGEAATAEWLDLCSARGACAINLIVDRMYTPGVDDARAQRLRDILEHARRRDWPVFVGTEMNSPDNRFSDDFSTAELAPYAEDFLNGARLAYAHTRLQQHAGMGLLSPWAERSFSSLLERNDFFQSVGFLLDPAVPYLPDTVTPESSPRELLELIRRR